MNLRTESLYVPFLSTHKATFLRRCITITLFKFWIQYIFGLHMRKLFKVISDPSLLLSVIGVLVLGLQGYSHI